MKSAKQNKALNLGSVTAQLSVKIGRSPVLHVRAFVISTRLPSIR